ncbi:MAG: methyltetrahydrofolate cobalamin methyltransferase [bacterium]|jgi:cobalamin-dependent methionine synthase I
MLIVGERINTSRKGIAPAVEALDAVAVLKEAQIQVESGCTMVDVNCGTLVEREAVVMEWLVRTVQESVDVPLCIDTPDPKVLEAGLKVHRGKALVNSITAEKQRYDTMVPLVKEYDASVVALCISERGMPKTVDDRMRVVDFLVEKLTGDGIGIDDIYIDPLVQPLATEPDNGRIALDTVNQIMSGYPGIHTICGLSNISFGLPCRRLLNQTFLALMIAAGLDGVILDPLDNMLMSVLKASRVITGQDAYGMDYIKAYRAGRFR